MNSDNTVSLAPFVQAIAPYIASALGTVLTAFVGMAIAYMRKKWGLEIDAQTRDAIYAAAQNAAGSVVAEMAGPLGDQSIKIDNPLVKKYADIVVTKVPDAIKRFGLTPDDVARLVQAEIGKFQAAQGPVPANRPG